MGSRHHRAVTLLAATVAAATPAVALPSTVSSAGVMRELESRESEHPVLRNDVAHFGTASEGQGTADRPRAPIVVRVEGGFDWAAAGVGAAGLLGLALVTGAAVSAIRHHPPVDETARPERALGKGQ